MNVTLTVSPVTTSERDIFADRYLIKRPLLQALEPDVAGAPVLLIDELDRADEAFEAYLLEILTDFQVTIPEFGTVKAPQPPIVIITSNRTREIHDALKRRCLYYWVDYPSPSASSRSSNAVPGISAKLSQQVVRFVQALREQDFYKSPGVAETIDWADRADRARRPLADPAGGRRHAGRAAEIPGRHRPDAGRRAAEGFEGSDERELARKRHSGAPKQRAGIAHDLGFRVCAYGRIPE